MDTIPLTDFDRLVLSRYPFPIAVNYRRVLEAQSWRERAEHAAMLFEFELRSMALVVISQYVIHDAEDFFDPDFNGLLLRVLPQARYSRTRPRAVVGRGAFVAVISLVSRRMRLRQ